MKQVLLFDYDGVIVDSLNDAHNLYNQLCTKYGCRTFKDKDEFTHLFDKSAQYVFKHLGVSFWKLPFMYHDYHKGLKLQDKHAKLVPGMKHVLLQLTKEHDVVVITSNVADVVEDVLARHKIRGIKSVLGSETSLSKVKKIHNVKKVFGHNHYYYIGDTNHDIIDGRAAGTKTVAVTWGYHTHAHLRNAHPDYFVDKPEGLLRLFG